MPRKPAPRQVPTKKARRVASKPRRPARLKDVPIPVGWYRLDDGENLLPGDAVREGHTWRTVVDETSLYVGTEFPVVIRRQFAPKSFEVKPNPKRQAELERQQRIKDAVAAGKDCVTVEPAGSCCGATSCGELGERMTPLERKGIRGSTILTATAIQPDELAAYLAKNPIFNKRHLNYVEPGMHPTFKVLYDHALLHIPDEDRQVLYRQGGMEAVRTMARRLAQHALDTMSPAKPARKRKSVRRKP